MPAMRRLRLAARFKASTAYSQIISERMNRGSPATISRRRRPWSSSSARPSSTLQGAILHSGSQQMASAAAAAQPPANTESWRNSVRPMGLSRLSLQAIVARSVWCRSGSLALPQVRTSSGAESRSSRAAGGKHLQPRRGSSSASGSPFRSTQIRATSAALASDNAKLGSATWARCTSNLTASLFRSCATRGPLCEVWDQSGGTRKTCSLATPSGARLVVRIVTPGRHRAAGPARALLP